MTLYTSTSCPWNASSTSPTRAKPASGSSSARPKKPWWSRPSLNQGKKRTIEALVPSCAMAEKSTAASTSTRVRPTSSVVSMRVSTKKVVTNPIATPR